MSDTKSDLAKELGKVTDPSDFSSTVIPSLVDFDSLLRCHICKDFLNVPVITPCSHTFCSLCIRQHLRSEAKCPLCLQDAQESSLISEYLLSEMVKCYRKKIRTDLLTSLTSQAGGVEKPHTQDIAIKQDRRKQLMHLRDSAQVHSPPNKKLKLENNKPKKSIMSLLSSRKTQTSSIPKGQCPICNNYYPLKMLETTHIDECLQNSLTKGQPKNNETGVTSRFVVNIDDEDEIAEEKPGYSTEGSLSPKETEINDTSMDEVEFLSSHSKTNKDAVASSPVDKDAGIITPVDMPFLNTYLDSALSSSTAQKQKIPKLDTANLSLSHLKSRLSDFKLATTGTKQQMVNRYNQWEMLWNSNYVDSLDPVSEKEIRSQLHNWEKHNNVDKADSSSKKDILVMFGSSNNSAIDIKSEKFSKHNWSTMHNKHFRALTKMAKKSMEKNKSVIKE